MTGRDELVRDAIAGDVTARTALGSWIEDELWRFYANCFSNDETIAELVQAAMLVVWTNATKRAGDNADEFLSWVLGVAGMTATGARTKTARELARQAKLSRRPPPTPARSPDSMLLDEQRRRLVDRCLRRLDTPYRDVVNHRLAGGRYGEFAGQRGITVKQARRRYQTAVRKLKVLIKRERVTATPNDS